MIRGFRFDPSRFTAKRERMGAARNYDGPNCGNAGLPDRSSQRRKTGRD